jgi:hypothetical protein
MIKTIWITLLLFGGLLALEQSSIAVMDFECRENENLGWSAAEIVRTELINQCEYTVLERSQLEKAFEEQKLQLSGAVGESTATAIGKIIGAQLMVIGSIVKMGSSYSLNSRVIDVSTGQAKAGKRIACQSESELPDACARLALQICGKDADQAPDKAPTAPEKALPMFAPDRNEIVAVGMGAAPAGLPPQERMEKALETAKADLFRDAMRKLERVDFKGEIVAKIMERSPRARMRFQEYLKKLAEPGPDGGRANMETWSDGRVIIRLRIPLRGKQGLFDLLEEKARELQRRSGGRPPAAR